MKKWFIYIGTAVGTFLIVLLAMIIIEKVKVNKMISSFNEAFEGEEKSIIFYASSQCGYCELEKPILKQISSDYDLDYISIDASLLNESQKKDMVEKLEIKGATPTTAIVQDGKVLNVQVGYLDGYDYVNFFKEAGILKENDKYLPEKSLNFIDYNGFNELENGILVLGQTASTTCTELRSTLNKISEKHNITFNYYDLRRLSRDEYYATYDKVIEMNEKKLDVMKDNEFYLPKILVIENGKIVNIINETEEDKIINELKKLKLIK